MTPWTPRLVVNAGAELGEGPVWVPDRERLYWTDIHGHTLWWVEPASGSHVTLDLPAAAVVQFWYRVSSEGSFDYLRFYIDNVQQGNGWSGNVPWAMASYNVAAGQHTFRWTYSKDASVNEGSDRSWIDEVYVGPT